MSELEFSNGGPGDVPGTIDIRSSAFDAEGNIYMTRMVT